MSYFSPRVPKSGVITSKRQTQQSRGKLQSANPISCASLRHRAEPERNPNSGCLETLSRQRPPASLKVERWMGRDVLCTVPHADEGCAWQRGSLELQTREAAAGSRSSSTPTANPTTAGFQGCANIWCNVGYCCEETQEAEVEFYIKGKISISFTNYPVLIAFIHNSCSISDGGCDLITSNNTDVGVNIIPTPAPWLIQ